MKRIGVFILIILTLVLVICRVIIDKNEYSNTMDEVIHDDEGENNEESEETTSDNIVSEEREKEKEIHDYIISLSLEEKISQMLIISIEDYYEDNQYKGFTSVNKSVGDFLTTRKPGGVILFSNNLLNYEQSIDLIKGIKDYEKDLPFFISVDEEGGIVSRIPSKNPQGNSIEVGNTGNSDNAYSRGVAIGKELNDLGFNVDFAPVMDINTNPNNPVIGVRSFSDNPKIVAEFGIKFMQGLESQGILSVAKHFPGHGDTSTDSHFGRVYVNHPIDRLETVELYPFTKAIEAGIDMIMVGHIIVPALDSEEKPATLSKKIVTDLLRKELNYDGIIITDAMNMGAISEEYTVFESTKGAINAGCDIILMPNIQVIPGDNIGEYDELVSYLVNEVNNGEIPIERINDSVYRIIKTKSRI